MLGDNEIERTADANANADVDDYMLGNVKGMS